MQSHPHMLYINLQLSYLPRVDANCKTTPAIRNFPLEESGAVLDFPILGR